MIVRAALLMAVLGLVGTGEARAKKVVRPNAGGVRKVAPAGAAQREHTFRGRVVRFDKDDGKGRSTVTVAHRHKNKQAKGQAGKVVTKTFVVNAATAFGPGAANLQKGTRVVVRYHHHHADRIELAPKKGKK